MTRDLCIPRTRVIDAQDNFVKFMATNNVDHRHAKAVETFLQRLNPTSLGNTNQTGNRLVSIPAMIGSGIGVGATMDVQPLTPEQRDALEKLAARRGLLSASGAGPPMAPLEVRQLGPAGASLSGAGICCGGRGSPSRAVTPPRVTPGRLPDHFCRGVVPARRE